MDKMQSSVQFLFKRIQFHATTNVGLEWKKKYWIDETKIHKIDWIDNNLMKFFCEN